jgi:hypothetical protein
LGGAEVGWVKGVAQFTASARSFTQELVEETNEAGKYRGEIIVKRRCGFSSGRQKGWAEEYGISVVSVGNMAKSEETVMVMMMATGLSMAMAMAMATGGTGSWAKWLSVGVVGTGFKNCRSVMQERGFGGTREKGCYRLHSNMSLKDGNGAGEEGTRVNSQQERHRRVGKVGRC